MVRPGRDRLSGRVEVDETYLGGLEQGVHGRQTERKALIVVVAQEDGKGTPGDLLGVASATEVVERPPDRRAEVRIRHSRPRRRRS